MKMHGTNKTKFHPDIVRILQLTPRNIYTTGMCLSFLHCTSRAHRRGILSLSCV